MPGIGLNFWTTEYKQASIEERYKGLNQITELSKKYWSACFSYEDAENEKKKPMGDKSELTSIYTKDLSGIPDALLKKLKQAAIDTDMDNVDGLINEIRELHAGVAERLSALADEFEYGKIVKIIERKMKQNDKT